MGYAIVEETMRKPIIAANWKMNKSVEEARTFVRELIPFLKNIEDREVVLCPPFTSLGSVAELIKDTNIALGAQNLYPEPSGPYTGEVSPLMLQEFDCRYVILGHSERRMHLFESHDLINRKVKAALNHKLSPILCVGEQLKDREAGREEEVVREHVIRGLLGVSKEDILHVVIAYEPVWAIGTGRNATPEDASRMHRFIRDILADIYGEEVANSIRIQYGGSVTPSNIDELMEEEEIDGVLVGGASLQAESFSRIVNYSSPVRN